MHGLRHTESPLPLTVGSGVARLAEALRVGALVDTTHSKTETTRGEQEGAVTPELRVVGALGKVAVDMVWGRPAVPSPDVAQPGFQWRTSEAEQMIPSKGAYLLEATERGHGHPTHCKGSSAELLPT